jgi:mRNA interferase MazF
MSPRDPRRGEVWWVDLGMTAKQRPCLVMSVAVNDVERALVTFVERTTQTRSGSRFEVSDQSRLFPNRPGVFDAQQLATIDRTRFRQRVGALTADQLAGVETAVKRWLGLDQAAEAQRTTL